MELICQICFFLSSLGYLTHRIIDTKQVLNSGCLRNLLIANDTPSPKNNNNNDKKNEIKTEISDLILWIIDAIFLAKSSTQIEELIRTFEGPKRSYSSWIFPQYHADAYDVMLRVIPTASFQTFSNALTNSQKNYRTSCYKATPTT